MIRALSLLDRRGLQLSQRKLALGLIGCLLLGAVVIADGVMVDRRETLEHQSFSGGWSMLDRPSHRPSALQFLGVLAGAILIRWFLASRRRFTVPSARLTRGVSRHALLEFIELRLRSRAPPSWSRL